MCRLRSAAAAHCGTGDVLATDFTSCAFGCSGVAVALTYTHRPAIARIIPPAPSTINPIHVSARFQRFATLLAPYSERIATIGGTVVARRAAGMPASSATETAIAAAPK